MMRLSIILVFVFISSILMAQSSKCKCSIAYEDLIEKLEQNYIGLALLKTNDQDAEYNKRKVEFREKVSNISIGECTRTLQQFLSYFQDGHLFVF